MRRRALIVATAVAVVAATAIAVAAPASRAATLPPGNAAQQWERIAEDTVVGVGRVPG